MARVVNAVTVDGTQISFDVVNGKFRHVKLQARDKVLPQTEASTRASAERSSDLDLGAGADFNQSAVAGAIIDAGGATILPAGVDVHVHSRDPGLTHKETWQTLVAGAWRGGVAAVADMPNTLPPTLTRATVLDKAKLAMAAGLDDKFLLGVGAGNIGEVAALLTDAELPICALKVFYGRTTGELVYDDLEALARALPDHLTKPIVFHSEDQCTIDCNHTRLIGQTVSRANSAFAVHSEIRSSAAAHLSTRTILDWARKSYRRPVHIAHVSTPVEVEMIAEARAGGASVTCEVAPHHLLMSTDDYERLGPLVKMNPPLRSKAEMEALGRLVALGAVDVYATDHAPHLLAEKQTDVEHAPSGVPSLEFFYPLLFAVSRRIGLELTKAIAMASARPAQLFGFKAKGQIADGFDADFVWLSEAGSRVANQSVLSKCGWSPYDGMDLPRDVLATWVRGRRVYAKAKCDDISNVINRKTTADRVDADRFVAGRVTK